MHDSDKTKKQLLRELASLRQTNAALEAREIVRQQEEGALQDSATRYRHLVENSLGFMCIHDLDGVFLFVNPTSAREIGYHPDEMIGKKMDAFLAPSVWHMFDEYLQRIRQQPTDSGLICVMTKQGEERVWMYRNVRYETAGNPPYVLGHAQDITERVRVQEALKQAHEALEKRVAERTAALQEVNAQLRAEIAERRHVEATLSESEARYRHLVESSVGFITVHDIQGRLLSVNPAAARALGYQPAEVIGRHVQELLPTSVRHLFDKYLERIQQHSTVRGLVRLMTKDGKPRAWAYHNVRIEEAGKPPYVLGHAQDITERKQAEEALQRSEELNRKIVEAVPGGIVQVSQDGTVVRANREAGRILGIICDDQTPRSVADFAEPIIWEDGSPCTLPDYPVSRCLTSNQPQPATTLGVRRPDGRLAWAIFTAIPLADPVTGQCTGAVVTFLDITERKQAEEDHKRLEVQLRQAHKMEAIGTLAGGIAHEFNNILGVILGFTDLTQYEVPQGGAAWANSQEVLKAGQRAKDLVKQILTFSRQGEQERQPVQFNLVVKEVLVLLRASLPTTIEIRQAVDSYVGSVLADRTQLHQIVMNLCSNAEYAMRETGGLLEVSSDAIDIDAAFAAHHAALQPGPHIRLAVSDTGQGIGPEIVEHIFDPFFTTKGVGEGTGMGLAIVHGIVTSHGGAITVQSRPGDGTSFVVYLPQVQEMTAAAAGAEEPILSGKASILFVDDEAMLAHLGRGMLERLGYHVVSHTSSLDALVTFRAAPHRFDLVITDQTMPQMTGERLAQELRRIRPDIPIVLCTGFSHVMHAEKAQAMGIDAFLMKPLVARDLAIAIQQVLQHRSMQET